MAEMDDVADLSPLGELDVTAGVHKAGYQGNWKLQFENSVDGYHANFTHRSYFDVVHRRTGFDPKAVSTSASPARIRDLGNGHSSWDVSAIAATTQRHSGARASADEAARVYVDSLIARHGKERAEYLLAKTSTLVVVFPNLALISSHIRLIQPIGVEETEVFLFPTLLKGAPGEINTRRLRSHEAFYGPAGGGAPDDLEIFTRNQLGLRAKLDPWLLLARGITQEETDSSGVRNGQMTDETPQRAMWRAWSKLLASDKASAESTDQPTRAGMR
ncbi:MAG TPA: RHO alpha subunit C-terminal catalytic domain-containing protein [Steroidobacter sp.]|nr:RHO alpha subunit C-terminal catalytic domain-containing protein [Steroidobacter sp.]